jgi:hypothetical protein
MATTTREHPVAPTANDLVRRTFVGVLVAVVAVLGARVGADLLELDLVAATATNSPFDAIPLVASSAIAGAGAAVVYAGLVRYTARPTRNFLVVAAAVFAAMLVPVAAFAPELGVTATGQLTLVVLHVAVAVPIVAAIVGLRR